MQPRLGAAQALVPAIVLAIGAIGCAAKLPPEQLADMTAQARAGNVALQLELGDRYRDGRGVSEDRYEAARWYRVAMDSGASAGLSRLACLGPGFYDRSDLLGDDGALPDTVPRPSPGDDITPPELVSKVVAKYTSDGMRNKIQGEVEIEALLLPSGDIGEVQVTKSLDATFGLDDQALCAALQWQFRPATRGGQPIAVIVTLVMEFRLH